MNPDERLPFGLQPEDLLGMAAACGLAYLFLKHPKMARQALQVVNQILATPAPAPALPPVALETVQQRLEELRRPLLAKPRRKRRP